MSKKNVRLLNMAVNDLINEQIKGGLQKMSDESTTGGLQGALKPVDFLAAKRSFEASIEKINALINGISAIPSVMKSNTQLTIEGRIHEIKNRFNIDLTPIIKDYNEQIAAIVNKINSLTFSIAANNGKIISQTGLAISADLKNNSFTAKEISDLRLKATGMKVLSPREKKAIETFNLFSLNNLNSAINSYGQSYRMNMDDTGKKTGLGDDRENIFRSLCDARAVWSRPRSSAVEL